MKSQLYLDKFTRQRMIAQLRGIETLYFEKIEPTFAEPQKEAELYTKQLEIEVSSSIDWGSDDAPSPEPYQEMVNEAGLARYELLVTMQYRTLGLWISCISQVWEQQLYTWILHNAQAEGIIYDDKFVKLGFQFVSEILDFHSVDYKLVQSGKIEEMRELVNTIKHGEGRSEVALRAKRPDLFASGSYDPMKVHRSTLLEPVLNISNQDFRDYLNALIEFWDTFPERAYSKQDIPVAP